MNPPDLESVLRAAPQPSPPADLKEKLTRQVRQPRNVQKVAPDGRTLSIGGWVKRWWPTLAFGGGILACATALVTQQAALRDLRAAAAGSTAAGTSIAPRAAAQGANVSPDSLSEAAPTPNQRAEIARLRAELAELQTTSDRLQQLVAENQRLQKNLADARAALPGISSEDLKAAQVANERASSIACVNNLKQIGLALRIWATHNADTFPQSFLVLTNELGTPKILVCPGDSARHPAVDWASYGPGNLSYEFLAPGGTEQESTRVVLRCPIHGNIGLCDGSVQMAQGTRTNITSHLVSREGKLYWE